jgi:hypothetical protein
LKRKGRDSGEVTRAARLTTSVIFFREETVLLFIFVFLFLFYFFEIEAKKREKCLIFRIINVECESVSTSIALRCKN